MSANGPELFEQFKEKDEKVIVNKGYLVEIGSNKYEFRQLPIVPVSWDFFWNSEDFDG